MDTKTILASIVALGLGTAGGLAIDNVGAKTEYQRNHGITVQLTEQEADVLRQCLSSQMKGGAPDIITRATISLDGPPLMMQVEGLSKVTTAKPRKQGAQVWSLEADAVKAEDVLEAK